MSEADNPQEGRGSPFSGCFILSAIIIIFGGLIVLYTFMYHKLNREIDAFTSDQPIEIRVAEPDEKAIKEVNEKLFSLKAAVTQDRAERVAFSAENLNAMIASLDVAKDFRGQTEIVGIEPGGLVAKMAQPMRKGVIQKGVRYLNGTFRLQPEMRARTIAFKVSGIDSVKGEVPQGFVDGYAGIDFLKLDPEMEAMKLYGKSIKRVYTEKDKLIVETGVQAGGSE